MDAKVETPIQKRRRLLRGWYGNQDAKRRAKVTKGPTNAPKKTVASGPKTRVYQGKETVKFATAEPPGTIIIRTRERALFYVLGGGKAIRYGVAVGKEGFSWAGTARIGAKQEWPTWTPPAEMIERKPEYEEWADGMPGGIPENPLGARAMYLYQGKKDTLFRIHGTNNPASIGTAASSGCIRMLNDEVIDLYDKARIGAKVVVL
jgi:lipoprotein-anchoring transpeptidase ErfK/SrfK